MDQVRKRDFVKVFPFFGDAPEDLVSDILALSRPHRFEKGRTIFQEGDVCSAIGFFFGGEVRVFKTGPAGREITLYTVRRGDACILNAACILGGIGYPAKASTTEDSEALLLPTAHFKRLVHRHAEMRGYVFSLLGARFTEMIELVEEVLFRKMDERIKEYLLERAPRGTVRTTHQKIANDLGTSREVVSRLLEDLARTGFAALGRKEIRLKR